MVRVSESASVTVGVVRVVVLSDGRLALVGIHHSAHA